MSRDGGHHAIKGFAFQFDASLLQILANPTDVVEIEGAQDIGVQTFHIQVKHRTAPFSLSRIAPAIRQMMRQFAADQSARFALYCHFPDRIAGETMRITRGEVDIALGPLSNDYRDDMKDWFVKSFNVIFAPDYMSQFREVLDRLRRVLRAHNESEALCWHAVIQGHLRDVILKRVPGDRKVSLADLKDLVHEARAAVFEASYAQFCGYEKYLRILREQYKSRGHVPPRERLFVVECDDKIHTVDLVDIVADLRSRYRVGESPPPYVSFRGPVNLRQLKYLLWREREHFHDGFDYGGAEFSASSLVSPRLPGYDVKLVDFDLLGHLVGLVEMYEVHDFYLVDPIVNPFSEARVRQAILESPSDLREIFRGRR